MCGKRFCTGGKKASTIQTINTNSKSLKAIARYSTFSPHYLLTQCLSYHQLLMSFGLSGRCSGERGINIQWGKHLLEKTFSGENI